MGTKNAELTQEEMLVKAKKDALRLLSFRPRSIEELRSRLLRKGYEAILVEGMLEYLVKQGMLDDEKFAKLYALSRIQSRPTGKKQIEFDLKRRGVPPAVVRRAMGNLEDFDEKQMALDVARKRRRSMSNVAENVSKQRIYGFLKRRGFASESVFYALSKLYKDTEGLE